MTWWERRMCAFDLETTHPSPEEARIVTAAFVLVSGGEETWTRTWLADPGVEIPEEATAVHGVTTERARAEGEPAAKVVREVAELLAEHADKALVIMNARYDLTVLDRECRRHGVGPLPLSFGPVVDPLVVDKHIDRYRPSYIDPETGDKLTPEQAKEKGIPSGRTLEGMCLHYDAVLDGAHDAAHDALAAARLAYRIGSRGQIVRRVWNAEMGREKAALARQWEAVRGDLRMLYAIQGVWAEEQARGLREHFEKEGQHEDAASVREDWPIIGARMVT